MVDLALLHICDCKEGEGGVGGEGCAYRENFVLEFCVQEGRPPSSHYTLSNKKILNYSQIKDCAFIKIQMRNQFFIHKSKGKSGEGE